MFMNKRLKKGTEVLLFFSILHADMNLQFFELTTQSQKCLLSNVFFFFSFLYNRRERFELVTSVSLGIIPADLTTS
jgi:hypothetical protein